MTYAEVIEKISALSSQIQELYAKISGLISEHNKYVELLKFETL
jgi:outer membrane murein-binding lipoprotein Lpp